MKLAGHRGYWSFTFAYRQESSRGRIDLYGKPFFIADMWTTKEKENISADDAKVVLEKDARQPYGLSYLSSFLSFIPFLFPSECIRSRSVQLDKQSILLKHIRLPSCHHFIVAIVFFVIFLSLKPVVESEIVCPCPNCTLY